MACFRCAEAGQGLGEGTWCLRQSTRLLRGHQLGITHRSGVPALVVLDAEGEEIAFLEAERRGAQALAQWPGGAGEW